jgi:hypothetical protein
MASGHVNRIKRPNTWLHRPMLQNVKKALANPEPSTHGTKALRSLSKKSYRIRRPWREANTLYNGPLRNARASPIGANLVPTRESFDFPTN